MGVSIDGWINGGFEVSEYEETGQVSNCQGEPQDVICVYWRAAYTDYTVDAHDLCGVEPEYQTVIQSPNSNGVGSTYLCGRNAQCQNRGFEFWNTSKSGLLHRVCSRLRWSSRWCTGWWPATLPIRRRW